jgi:hypothetical protein
METGSQSSQNITCSNALIRVFLTHMFQDEELEIGEITTEETSITINESSLTTESLKMWLVLLWDALQLNKNKNFERTCAPDSNSTLPAAGQYKHHLSCLPRARQPQDLWLSKSSGLA